MSTLRHLLLPHVEQWLGVKCNTEVTFDGILEEIDSIMFMEDRTHVHITPDNPANPTSGLLQHSTRQKTYAAQTRFHIEVKLEAEAAKADECDTPNLVAVRLNIYPE